MRSSIKKSILSLTLNEFVKLSVNDILEMLKKDFDNTSSYSKEYSLSIARSIVKRIFLIKEFSHDYKKFYQVIIASDFRKNKYIKTALEDNRYISLKKILELYNEKKYSSLIDDIFKENEIIYDELISSNNYDINNIFSEDILKKFNKKSYKRFLSYLTKDSTRSRVVRALLKEKNNKFVYIVAEMDNLVLSTIDDDSGYFDMVLALFNYNNYRRLLWDYYNKFVQKNKNIKTNVLKELLNYSFTLINVKYTTNKLPEIINSIDELLKALKNGKDMVHIAVFGIEGYKKVRNNTFDIKKDFFNMNNDNQLLNLKIAFLSTIYGLTYNQAEKLIKNFDNFVKEFEGVFDSEDSLTYETMIAIKSLYNLKIEDKEEINLYRETYYKYIRKKGLYATVDINALVIMEKLVKKMYNNSIEVL